MTSWVRGRAARGY